jgi:integrase
MEASWRAELFAWEAEQLAGGLASSTIALRLHWMRQLQRHCSQSGPGGGQLWIWAVTRPVLVSWLATPRWGSEARRSARSTARSVYSWASVEGLIVEDPSLRLPKVKIPPPCPRPAPDDVIRRGLLAADTRVSLMLLLGAVGGLRRAEISRVHTSHLHGMRLRVHLGKGGRSRYVPLTPALAMLISSRPPGWLFPNRVTGAPLTPGHVGRLMSAALPGPWTPHSLRHAAASALADQGLDYDEIGAFLGHALVTTTQRYVLRRKPRLEAAVVAAARRLEHPAGDSLAAGS